MIARLFNPFTVFASLKRQGESYLLLLILTPFLEAALYEHLSIILLVIGGAAFLRIVHLVTTEDVQRMEDE